MTLPFLSLSGPVLVSAGRASASIDGVRCFRRRATMDGEAVAHALSQTGADVTLLKAGEGDMLTQGLEALAARTHALALQLAAIPAFAPRTSSPHKLKVKTGEGSVFSLSVLPAPDPLSAWRAAHPLLPLAGWDAKGSFQAYGVGQDVKAWLAAFVPPALPSYPVAQGTGPRVLITGGPTEEPLTLQGDVLTNYSSGLQAHALAHAFMQAGARVTLVSGPVELLPPDGVKVIYVRTACEMLDACLHALPAEVFVACAAVGDFSLSAPLDLRVGAFPQALNLTQNPDILATLARHPAQRPRLVVGFAAETHDLLAYARAKLASKGADMLLANDAGLAAGSARNHLYCVMTKGVEDWGEASKNALAQRLVETVFQRLAISSG